MENSDPFEVSEFDKGFDEGYKKGITESSGAKLIDVWCQNNGGRIDWNRCVKIVCICGRLGPEEEQRLLDLGSMG